MQRCGRKTACASRDANQSRMMQDWTKIFSMIEEHQEPIDQGPTGANTNPETELKTALENAKYAAPTCRACTDPARKLVDHVLSLLPEDPSARTRLTPESGGGAGWKGSSSDPLRAQMLADGTHRWYQGLGRQAIFVRKNREFLVRSAPLFGRAIKSMTYLKVPISENSQDRTKIDSAKTRSNAGQNAKSPGHEGRLPVPILNQRAGPIACFNRRPRRKRKARASSHGIRVGRSAEATKSWIHGRPDPPTTWGRPQCSTPMLKT